MKWFKWFSRKAAQRPVVEDKPLFDEHGVMIDDPILTRIVNHSFTTGEMVVWNEGDDLPKR